MTRRSGDEGLPPRAAASSEQHDDARNDLSPVSGSRSHSIPPDVEKALPLWIASQQLIDALIERGSQAVGWRVPMPRSIGIWPIRELDTQRRTVATASAHRWITRRVATAYRGLRLDAIGHWQPDSADWLVIAGMRLHSGEPDAANRMAPELCGLLYDRRIGTPLAGFRQKIDATTIDLVPTGIWLDAPVVLAWRTDLTPATPADQPGTPFDSDVCMISAAQAEVSDAIGRNPVDEDALKRWLPIERGIAAYDDGRYADAVRIFSQAVRDDDRARFARLGLALAFERTRSTRSARAWRDLVNLLLDDETLSLLPVPGPAAAGAARDAGLPAPVVIWRHAAHAVANRLRLRRQCMRLTAYRDAREKMHADPTGPLARAASMSAWLNDAATRRLVVTAANEASPREPWIGLGSSDVRDAWDRRLDLTLTDCEEPSAPPRHSSHRPLKTGAP